MVPRGAGLLGSRVQAVGNGAGSWLQREGVTRTKEQLSVEVLAVAAGAMQLAGDSRADALQRVIGGLCTKAGSGLPTSNEVEVVCGPFLQADGDGDAGRGRAQPGAGGCEWLSANPAC